MCLGGLAASREKTKSFRILNPREALTRADFFIATWSAFSYRSWHDEPASAIPFEMDICSDGYPAAYWFCMDRAACSSSEKRVGLCDHFDGGGFVDGGGLDLYQALDGGISRAE